MGDEDHGYQTARNSTRLQDILLSAKAQQFARWSPWRGHPQAAKMASFAVDCNVRRTHDLRIGVSSAARSQPSCIIPPGSATPSGNTECPSPIQARFGKQHNTCNRNPIHGDNITLHLGGVMISSDQAKAQSHLEKMSPPCPKYGPRHHRGRGRDPNNRRASPSPHIKHWIVCQALPKGHP